MTEFLRVFLGSYEHFVLRFDVLLDYKSPETEEKKYYKFHNVFTQKNHTSVVKCIDVDPKGRYLATGGGDDRIVIVDLKLNREIQRISHTGTVNSVKFTPDGCYLFSTSEDGTILATKTGSWQAHQIWRTPHTSKAVWSMTIHPSGKVAMSIGNDSTIRTWNLVKGSQVCTTNVKELSLAGNYIHTVEFSPNGDTFMTIGGKELLVISVETGSVVYEQTFPDNISSMCWLNEKSLLIGHQNGTVTLVKLDCNDTAVYDCSLRNEFKAAGNTRSEYQMANGTRIKQMSFYNNFLMTLMSCGALTMWRLSRKNLQLKFITTVDVGCRPVCMKLMGPLVEVMPRPLKLPIESIKKEEKANADLGDESLLMPLVKVTNGDGKKYKTKKRNRDEDSAKKSDGKTATHKKKPSLKTRYEDDSDFEM